MRCTLCGGVIREKRGVIACDSCAAGREGEAQSPDVWDLVEHPEDYDTEARRQRTQQKRFL